VGTAEVAADEVEATEEVVSVVDVEDGTEEVVGVDEVAGALLAVVDVGAGIEVESTDDEEDPGRIPDNS
jgi:hypothetical protein